MNRRLRAGARLRRKKDVIALFLEDEGRSSRAGIASGMNLSLSRASESLNKLLSEGCLAVEDST